MPAGPRAKVRYKLLEAKKGEVEAGLGVPLEWRELPNHKESHLRYSRQQIDPKDLANWPEICDWLIDWTEKFQAVFRPIVRDLDVVESAADERPKAAEAGP